MIYSSLFFFAGIFWLLFFRSIGSRPGLYMLFGLFTAGLLSGPIAGSVTLILKSSLDLNLLEGRFHDFILYFFLVGPVEEGLKFTVVFLTVISSKEFNRISDGLVLTAACALGFASGENLLYLNAYGADQTILRLFFSNIGHVAFSSVWGYGLGASLHERAGPGLLLYSLLGSSLLHGAYDFFLTWNWLSAVFVMILTILSFLFIIQFYKSEIRR